MKLVKSLLLGSAAGLFAVAGAQAADLPVRKAAPVVDYVRVCSAYGTGFFFIPGTETCLRVSGRVRAEYTVQETYRRDIDSTFNWRARGQLNIDARTQTAYGTLRTFLRYELTRNLGSAYGAPAYVNSITNNTVDLNKAFIQFAGITAGRATSFFDFYATAILFGTNGGSDTDANLLAYTASFGSGISASISLEDPTARRGVSSSTVGFGPTVSNLAFDSDLRPHVVGQLRIEQAWGTAQLSGAAFQIRPSNVFTTTTGGVVVVDRPDTEYGFAIQGGLKINLPMLAAGDQLWLQAAYSNGNASYLGSPGSAFGSFVIGGARDAFLVDGEVERVKGFSLTAAFLHYWTPQIRQGIYANWRQIDVPGSATAGFATTGIGFGPGVFASGAAVDFNRYELGTNLIWSPVAGLDIGVEVLYQKVATKNGRVQVVEPAFAGATPTTIVGTRRSEDNYQARLRIQRDF